MEEKYLNFNLKVKNLFIGLCTGIAGLPTVLRELAYRVKWVEFNFQNSKDKIVKPELIFTSDKLQNTVMLESKAGGNIEKEQHDRYCDVTKDDLRERAFIEPKCLNYVDITYVVPEYVAEKASSAFDKFSVGFPLLSISLKNIGLRKNSFSNAEVTSLFKAGLSINYEEIPCHFIPFDNESPVWIVAEKIVPIVLNFLYDNKSFFTSQEILEKLIPMWSNLSNEEKREMRQKVSKVLRISAEYEFKGFIRKNINITRRTHTDTWDIEVNPLKRKPSKRVRVWKQLQNRQKLFIERLKTGKRQSIQLDFFEDL